MNSTKLTTHDMAARLPNLLTFADGKAAESPADWDRRRQELLAWILDIEYGPLPPAPESVNVYTLHSYRTRNGIDATHYRVTALPGPVQFTLTIYTPDGDGPFPVIVDGDGCWRYDTNEVLEAVTTRGFALAMFNRVEIVPDNGSSARDCGLYLVYPDVPFTALGAWAWGYHRAIDALTTLPHFDSNRIVAVGHSRGGKTALLAGATDTRIALTAANNSGSAGAASFYFPDEGYETIAHMRDNFPYWYSQKLFDYIGRESELPFDQHVLASLIAPRALLTTEALDDAWASPRGAYVTHLAAREVFRKLDADNSIGIWYREGVHAHLLEDWITLLDFADMVLNGKPSVRDYHSNRWD